MTKFINVTSHNLTAGQKLDAIVSYGVLEFVELPQNLKTLWGNIPAEMDTEEVVAFVAPIINFLDETVRDDKEIVLLAGDMGATTIVLEWIWDRRDVKAVQATTAREVVEKEENGVIVKTSIFKHVRFREYKFPGKVFNSGYYLTLEQYGY